ncbi:MAG: hypothetical protein CSA07_00235 [Bacteroidia bacterium]|nr:MAG: hypothetical protein CSA07_00235 [Bacteroidia bacterium]
MRILNPLYDTIFKYLMEDRQAAMDLISIILSTKVLALEPQPQETSTALHEIHVYRLDYKAIIRDREGERKTVLIEIQKYNTHDPVSRFRRYLAKAYASRETALSPEGRAEPLPIVTIYILGFRLPEFPCQSIRVENRAYNNITDEPLQVRSRFVELLTHRCYILIAADPQGEAQGDQGAPTAAEKVELEKLRGLFVRRQKGGSWTACTGPRWTTACWRACSWRRRSWSRSATRSG